MGLQRVKGHTHFCKLFIENFVAIMKAFALNKCTFNGILGSFIIFLYFLSVLEIYIGYSCIFSYCAVGTSSVETASLANYTVGVCGCLCVHLISSPFIVSYFTLLSMIQSFGGFLWKRFH